jgi:dihydropteroate synthase type 2
MSRMQQVGVFGIVNVTRDSFSDGGRWLDPERAIVHAEALLAAGADVLDLGAESTHPDAEDVPAAEELRRLEPVVDALMRRGATISIDTRKAEVMRVMAARGVAWLNDVHGFRDPASLAAAGRSPSSTRFVVMFARSDDGRARRVDGEAQDLLAELRAFVAERRRAFAAIGIAPERLVFDPGMGHFLGRQPAPSLWVLRHLRTLCDEFGPMLVSVSRKSFLGAVTGRDVAERGAATLAAELHAVRQGAAFVRTHDVQALRDALLVERAIGGAS